MENPKIRFLKNKHSWVRSTFEEIAKRRTKSSDNPDLPRIEYQDILSGEGRLNKELSKNIDCRKGIVFETNDILYGKLRPYLKNWLHPNFNGIALGDFWVLQARNCDSKFLFSLVQSPKFQRVANDTSGTKMPRSDWKTVSQTEFSIPDSNDEQSAIGSLFRTLDDLLASYKDNLANYQSLKATMLSKMFPKAGQTVPEIRLDGFEDRWEERCIGELADIVRGASPRPIQDPKWFDSNSEIGWLRISDVTNQNGRIHSLEQKISKLGQEKTRVLTEPHLLLSIAATVGKPVVNYVKTGVHDGFLIFMNPKFDREFMFQWLEMFREKWNRYGQPGSQVNLNSDIVKNQKILIPSMEEQRAIGTYFSNLDNLINSHQEKISQLETLKKKLLQDMFI